VSFIDILYPTLSNHYSIRVDELNIVRVLSGSRGKLQLL